jgi:hypothetical protein
VVAPPDVVVVVVEFVVPEFAAPPVVAGPLTVVLERCVVELHGCQIKSATRSATTTIARIANIAAEFPDPSLTTTGRSVMNVFSFKRWDVTSSFPAHERAKRAPENGECSLIYWCR